MENMTFKDAWTLPFKGDPIGYTIYIWDSKNHVCFNYLDDDREKYDRIINLLNGEDATPFKKCNIKGDYISVYDYDVDVKPILLVRGWGYLTGSGGLKLDAEKAKKLQEDLIEYCRDKLIKS